MQGLPTVRIDDIIIHPRDRDLIAGTHGRSIWIVDDISPLEQMTDQTMTQDATLFDVRPATAWVNDIQKQITVGGQKNFRGQNPDPGHAISYWLKADAQSVRVEVLDVTGRVGAHDRRTEDRRPEPRAAAAAARRTRRRWRRRWRGQAENPAAARRRRRRRHGCAGHATGRAAAAGRRPRTAGGRGAQGGQGAGQAAQGAAPGRRRAGRAGRRWWRRSRTRRRRPRNSRRAPTSSS